MEKQRRYDLNVIADEMEKLVSQLNDLADEEQSAFDGRPHGLQFSVSGFDSQEAFRQIRVSADIIGNEVEKLRLAVAKRPD
jgi:hypothetical protein